MLYIVILIYFLLVETAIIYAMSVGRKKTEQRKTVNLYLVIRVIKITVSLAFIGVYSLVVKTGIKHFVLIFMLFYFFSIGFETWYFIKIERQIKERKEK